ncbi:MAG: mechanosensitive ion channel protein MscS [Gemmatimonadetes bacterium]|nr:mechanosensitive ion channel protein MscS [Gemmatimonadota bacterium]
MNDLLSTKLLAFGLDPTPAGYVAEIATLSIVLLLALVADRIARRILIRGVQRVAVRTESQWDDILVRHGVFERLAHLAPLFVLRRFAGAGALLPEELCISLTGALFTIVAVLVFLALVDAVLDIYEAYPISKEVPISAYAQGLKGIAVFFTCVFVISALMQADPWVFIKGIGALTAVLLLVFKDTILGLVGSIQLTANSMVRIGDWIEMSQYGADGDVIEVGLTSVKVQNWDKTTATIPTYALISDSFRNWRGMSESGGRRIKRAIHIDMTSIKFCTPEMLRHFEKIDYLRDYLKERRAEIESWNEARDIDLSNPVNGRRLTNLGTFQAYLRGYLRAHPMVNRNMTFLVRQLAPCEKGVPIEIYVFSSDQNWVSYEAIQADIMDHVLAVIGEFDLRVFQAPTGADMRALSSR